MTLSTLLSAPYNYFMGNAPKKTDVSPDINVDDFEYIKTDEEALQDKRAKIIALADTVFISTSQDEVTYSYEALTMGGTIRADNPLPFEKFRNNPYLRRCEQINPLFSSAGNYQKVLSEHIVQGNYGNKGITPTRHLQARLAEKDPVALRISAMLFQLGDDANMCPSIPNEHLSSLDGKAVAIPHEVGTIDLQSLNKFTIKNDFISIADTDGTIIATYKVDRSVEIGYPNLDGSVECKVSRTFDRIHPSSDV